MEKVIAMYDIRGIQKYIYRTQKIKDAMGASALVENIIERALKEASKKYKTELQWYNEEGVLPFEEKDLAVQVLFIGGGNAYVLFENKSTCQKINKHMSRYVLEKTYSLQLAAAYVLKSERYSEDYKNLHEEMNRVKAKIKSAKPIGALPVMQTEIKTGYPLSRTETFKNDKIQVSTETYKKDKYKEKTITEEEEKILDNLICQKGLDSNLAVVHIDGNNMGSRIRSLIERKEGYADAVNEMRKISYNIKFSYLKTFERMIEHFDPGQDTERPQQQNKQTESLQDVKKLIRKIVVAGDDITYVCNAGIALDTAEYFAREIAGCTMNGEPAKTAPQYGFSICAGVAYMKSHFPFSIAYDVAEACCDNAKERAKSKENMDGTRIGNYIDFQICGSVQCRNLKETRRKDYETPTGERLLIRPYYIPTDYDGKLAKSTGVSYHYGNFKNNVKYFLNEKIPRSFAKQIRNTYPLGCHEIKMLEGFLKSRGWKMPDGKMDMFGEDGTALWYDALEMMDYCIAWKDAEDEKEADSSVQKPAENRAVK